MISKIPPLNFAQISPGVYRSGYPNRKNFEFLENLKLKSVMYIGTLPKKEHDLAFHRENLRFYDKSKIRFLHLNVGENREPFLQMDHNVVYQVMEVLLDSKNHPILMHCLRGKIPCSCVTGCYRKVQQWSLTSIFDEYERYVGSLRPLDIQFLELFDVGELRDYDDSRRCRTGSSSTNSNKEGTWHDKKEDEEEEKDNEKKKEGD